MKINTELTAGDLKSALDRFWDISGQKIKAIHNEYDPAQGSPVFTVKGKYTTRGWTEWTQGFQYGSEILQYDATGDDYFLASARKSTVDVMAAHVSHFGVHDHGFNNVSTYGNLLRLMNEGRIPEDEWQRNFYELALKVSGAVQARRWTKLPSSLFPELARRKDACSTAKAGHAAATACSDKGLGYVYSFNGPHSLFADTIRSMRALAVSHQLGHVFMGENDIKIPLLERLVGHARTTAKYVVYYGQGRDAYDVRGRTAHEGIFNLNDGNFRCPNSQQGFSPFTTWTRGLAWIMVGYAEQLEYLATRADAELEPCGGRADVEGFMLEAAKATCDFFIENTPVDGIPYWDTGAPNLHRLGDYLNVPSDPYNDWEPVDGSAAAIGVQALFRLGHYLQERGETEAGQRYWQAGLTTMQSLLADPYLSSDENHQGLTLHSIYHRPNGWDYIPPGRKIPCGESSMWGDYHVREAALYLTRIIAGKPYLNFFK